MVRIPKRPPARYLGAFDQLHSDPQRKARQHFDNLTRERQAEAIRKLANDGYGDYSIAAATRLSVAQVRQLLGPRP